MSKTVGVLIVILEWPDSAIVTESRIDNTESMDGVMLVLATPGVMTEMTKLISCQKKSIARMKMELTEMVFTKLVNLKDNS